MNHTNSETELLAQCTSIPVAFPGMVQPHGALLAIDLVSDRIDYLSENLPHFIFGSSIDWVGKKLSEIWPQQYPSLNNIDESKVLQVQNLPEDFPSRLEINVIRSERHCIYEFIGLYQEEDDIAVTLGSAFTELMEAESTQALHETIASQMQSIIGYGHIMIYQFDKSWNGRVIAEHIDPNQSDKYISYLDLHFPESDVPVQARELYRNQWLRMIADVQADAVPIHSDRKEPLDLSDCSLRSVAATHVKYLKNMGVAASLSVSVLVDGELWGLIAAHHASPRPLGLQTRHSAIELGKLYSALLSLKLRQSRQNWLAANKSILEWPMAAARDGVSFLDEDRLNLNALCNAFNAHGAVLVSEGQYAVEGQTPEPELVNLIVQHLSVLSLEDSCFQTDCLNDWVKTPDDCSIAGVLAIGAPAAEQRFILLFRNEETQEVNWSGDPRLQAMSSAGGGLSPRSSFEKWKQVLSDRSRPWTDDQWNLALALAENLQLGYSTLATMESAQKSAKLNMLNMLLHDIGNAISGVSGSVNQLHHSLDNKASVTNLTRLGQLVERQVDKFDEVLGKGKGGAVKSLIYEVTNALEGGSTKCESYVLDIESGLTHARELLDLQKAYAQSDQHYARECHLAELLVDAGGLLRSSIEARGKWVMQLPDALPAVSVDRSKIMQVIVNLMKNAYEAWDMREETDRPPFELLLIGQMEEGKLRLDIQDNGVGFDPAEAEKLFVKNYSSKERSSGLGLANSQRLAAATAVQLNLSSAGLNQGATATLIFSKELLV